jgi:hypothetical protein
MYPILASSNIGFSFSAFFIINGAIFDRKNITTSNEHTVITIPRVEISSYV